MHINLPLKHLGSELLIGKTPSDLLNTILEKDKMDKSPPFWEVMLPWVCSGPGAGASGHHVQELALLCQAGEHGVHVSNSHVADASRDGGQSHGVPGGGEAGGGLREAVEEAGAQAT